MTIPTPELMTRENSLENGVDPTGRKWGIGPDPNGWALHIIGIVEEGNVDEEGRQRVTPLKKYPRDELAGQWTTRGKAIDVLMTYLSDMWDMSDSQAAANVRTNNRPKVTESKSAAA